MQWLAYWGLICRLLTEICTVDVVEEEKRSYLSGGACYTTFNRGARPPIVKLDPTRTFSLSTIPA
jgi:hypothetical protein